MSKRTFADSPTNPTTTLAADLTATDTTLTLATDPGAEMPTTGPFSIIVGEGGAEQPVNCASRSGTTVTLVDPWDGNTHASGSVVNTGLARVDAEAFQQDDDVTAAIAAIDFPVDSVAGKTGAVSLDKSDVGLGSVDNTADSAKPVSTAQQTALDGKANSSHTHPQSDVTNLATDLGAKVAKAGGTMTGQLLLPDGSTSAPAFAFANNTNMGRRRSSNNNQRDVTNGVDVTNYASTLVTQLVPALFNQQFRLGQKFVDFDTLGADYTVTSSDGALIITASSSGSYNLNLPATSGSLYFITTDIVSDPVILPGVGATVAAGGGGTYRAVVVAYSTVIGGHILFAST